MSQKISNERILLPTSEACKISGFGRQYIERLLRQGRLEGVKPGRDWLVYEDSLLAFLAQPRKRGPKGPYKKSPPSLSDTSLVDVDEIRDARHENGSDKS